MENNNIKKKLDDIKTASEYELMILNYMKTGYLDRDEAIKKYVEFNANHPEYYAGMEITAKASGAIARIEEMPDNIIVKNLKSQFLYLTGRNIWEEIKNG